MNKKVKIILIVKIVLFVVAIIEHAVNDATLFVVVIVVHFVVLCYECYQFFHHQ